MVSCKAKPKIGANARSVVKIDCKYYFGRMDQADYIFAPFRHSDLNEIAALHALSWQRHYRGILPDSYLDHEVNQERLNLWTRRFEEMSPSMHLITLRKDRALVGFSGFFLDEHPDLGTYIDNLHVLEEHQGLGLGYELMRRTAEFIRNRNKNTGMYLHVFDVNDAAIRFYERIGGVHEETKDVEAPGGVNCPIRIYSWRDISEF